jgi:hypothetical protein
MASAESSEAEQEEASAAEEGNNEDEDMGSEAEASSSSNSSAAVEERSPVVLKFKLQERIKDDDLTDKRNLLGKAITAELQVSAYHY